MQVFIKNIIKHFATGYSFRGKVQSKTNGGLKVIQMKDVDYTTESIAEDLVELDIHDYNEKYYLKEGDVLFLAKGANNYAFLAPNYDYPVIASSAFFVLRLDQMVVDAEFLIWLINHGSPQQYLKDRKVGTYIPNVNKIDLLNMPLNLPSLKNQQLIAEIANLSKKERALHYNLMLKRNEMIHSLLNQSLPN